MSSAGQIVGGVVGGVVGALAGGNVMLGASIGMAIGGYIDPPKGPKIEGPRLGDLSVQTATYGAVIPRVYGTIAIFGNVFWVENNKIKESATTSSGGGKGGGGGSETTLYSYSATFAVGLCKGPIEGVRRIWCGGKIIYDAGSNDISSIVSSEIEGGGNLSIYFGTDDQLPDARMQATLGVSNTPAYRGLAYIVLNDLQLADYGNSLMGAQIKVEVITSATWLGDCSQTGALTFPSVVDGEPVLSSIRYSNERFYCSSLIYNGFDTTLFGVSSQQLYFTNPNPSPSSMIPVDPYEPGANGGNSPAFFLQSDENIIVFLRGVSILNLNGFVIFDENGGLVLDTDYLSSSFFPEKPYSFVADRGDIFATYDEKLYRFGRTIHPAPVSVSVSIDDFNARAFGASENYIFLVVNDGNTTVMTVKKVSRSTLLTVDTITLALDSRWASIQVVSDTTFYIMSGPGNVLNKYDAGVLTQTGLVYTGPRSFSFTNDIRFFVISDRMAVFFAAPMGGDIGEVYTASLSISGNDADLGEIIQSECLSSGMLQLQDVDVSLISENVRGYEVANIAAIRSAISPLQSAWPFDVINAGYKIKFIPRGQSSVITVPANDLGAVPGSDNVGVRLTHSREMATQLPRRINATYLDVNREYDTGSGPGAERLNTDAVNVVQVEMPIVMNATECAGIEEVLLYMYWLERTDVSIVLPPIYANLQPADVITVSSNDLSYELRLTEINYLPDGRVECSAKLNNSTIYTPTAVGVEGSVAGQALTYAGPTELILLDVPRMTAAQDAMGMPFGMFSYSNGWRGGVLMRSDDIGASYQAISSARSQVSIFIAEGILGEASPYSIDQCSSVTVRSNVVLSEIYSITEDQLYAHANLAAFGADGRWEIIAFQTVSDLGDGRSTISQMLRGLYGSERHSGSHAVGDSLVMLDQSVLGYCGMPSSAIGMPRLFRAVTEGKALDSAFDIEKIYEANNLKPLSPVDLKTSSTPGSGNWLINWVPRTRIPVELFSGVSVPLGESFESYEVDVLSADWSSVKRTISGLTVPSTEITLAAQTADFGEEQSALNLDVFQMSSTVGRGQRYRVVARRNGWESAHAAHISSGLHFNGTAGSQVFKDVKPGVTWATVGNAQIVTDASAFGGFSGSFDGSGDYISRAGGGAEFTPGIDEDFTICGWVTPAAANTVRGFVSTFSTIGQATGWQIYHDTNGTVIFQGRDTTSYNSYYVFGGQTVSTGVRKYIALTKKGRVWRLFVGGVSGDPLTMNVEIYNSTGIDLRYGRFSTYHPSYDFSGKLDDWRIYKGFCLYETNFSPPTDPFVDR